MSLIVIIKIIVVDSLMNYSFKNNYAERKKFSKSKF